MTPEQQATLDEIKALQNRTQELVNRLYGQAGSDYRPRPLIVAAEYATQARANFAGVYRWYIQEEED